MKAINNLVHLVWGMVTGLLAVVAAWGTLLTYLTLTDSGWMRWVLDKLDEMNKNL